MQQRDESIVAQALSGTSIRSIAETYGISREAVRKIIQRSGIDLKSHRVNSRNDKATFTKSISEWVCNHPGCSIDEIALALDSNAETIQKSIDKPVRHLISDRSTSSSKLGKIRWSNEQIIESLQQAATNHEELSQDNYDNARKSGNHNWPSGILIIKRFGKWNTACAAADVLPGRTLRDHYEVKFSIEELTSTFAEFLLESPSGSVTEYETWSEKHPNAPSSGVYRNHFGSWANTHDAALDFLRMKWNK